MKRLLDKSHSSQSGLSGIVLLIVILAILLSLDFVYVYLLEKCTDTPFNTCLANDVTNKIQPNSSVVATPTPTSNIISASGNFTIKNYSIYVTLNFPQQGGPVTGKVTGDCSASILGEFSGGDSGIITGQAFGSCSPLFVPIPAKANFSGAVDQIQKVIPITGTGTAAGISGSGSLTLTF